MWPAAAVVAAAVAVMRGVVMLGLFAVVGCGRLGFGDGNGDDAGVGNTCATMVDAACPQTTQSINLAGDQSSGSDTNLRSNNRDLSCGTPGTPEHSASYMVQETGTYRFSTSGSSLPVVLAITRDCDGAEIACQTDPGGVPVVDVALTEGELVTAFVEGERGECGDTTIAVSPAAGVAPAR